MQPSRSSTTLCPAASLIRLCVWFVVDWHRIGHFWTKDFGSSDDSDAFQYLLRTSPVHNVQSDKPYPAVLLTTGDHDDRVVPLHSYKYIAALQHAWDGNAAQEQPLLIRIEKKAGQLDRTATNLCVCLTMCSSPPLTLLLMPFVCCSGHGAGMPLAKRMAEQADVYAFISKACGVKLQWTDEQRQASKTAEEEVKA